MSNETQKSEQNSTLNKLRNEFGQVNLTDGSEQKKAPHSVSAAADSTSASRSTQRPTPGPVPSRSRPV